MFTWNGEEVNTLGELLTGAIIAMRENRATEYLAAYEATNEHARENLGYLFGYADDLNRRQLHEAYNLIHPIFGSGTY